MHQHDGYGHQMTAWREMDRAQKWAFGGRVAAPIAMLVATRYYFLWAGPEVGLPRLEFLPSPFEIYAEYICFGLWALSMLIMILFSRIQRKVFMKRMWDEYEAEKAEDEQRSVRNAENTAGIK